MFCLLLGLVAQACSDAEDPYSDVQKLMEQQDTKVREHLEEQNLEAEKDQYGVYRIPLKQNASGRTLGDGDVAEVSYTLTKLDGTAISSGEESMRLGFSGPIPTSDQYLPYYLYYIQAHMREGERYRFYLPYLFAYGSYKLENVIPAQSIVVMEIEVHELYKSKEALLQADIDSIERVISAEGLDADTLSPSGLRKIVKETAEGVVPEAGNKVSVYYTGKLLDGTVFDSNTGASQSVFSFEVGKGKVISGFDTAVKSMKKGEKAVFYIPSAQAYGNQGFYLAPKAFREALAKNPENAGLKIPPHSPLVFEIELVEVTQ